MTDYREYENGVADVLSSIVGDRAIVKRDVKLPGGRSGVDRQIDIVVEGTIFGMTHARMIVDCKRWKEPVDVPAMGALIDMANDVGADIAVIVSANGSTPGAQERARNERGIRAATLTLSELKAWRPKGTEFREVAVPRDSEAAYSKILRAQGFRVAPTASPDPRVAPDDVSLEVFWHRGRAQDDAQSGLMSATENAFEQLNIESKSFGSGVVAGGGTPQHRWIETRCSGIRLVKVLAATEEELADQISTVSQWTGIPVDQIEAVRPDGWPFEPFSL